MGGTFEQAALRDGAKVKVLPNAAQLHLQQLAQLRGRGPLEVQDFLETPPDGGVQQALVVGGRHHQTAAAVGVQHLQHGVYHAPQLAVFAGVFALLAERVELVEQHDHGRRRCEVEHLAEVRGGLAKKRRHHAVRADDDQRPAQFVSDHFGGERFAAARRPAEQDAVARLQPVRPQHLVSVVLVEDVLHQRQVGWREHHVLQAPRRLLHGAERQVAFTVRRDGVCERLQRGGCGPVGAAVEDRLEVVGQQVMMLLPLFRDQVLGDTAEGGNVSVRTGTKELPQQFAVCHAVNPRRTWTLAGHSDDGIPQGQTLARRRLATSEVRTATESPQPVHAVAVEHGVDGHEGHAVPDGLGDEHAVERVSVRPGQEPGSLGITHGDGQRLEALAGDGTRYVLRHQFGLRQLAQAVLGGDFPCRSRADQHVVGVVPNRGTRIGGQSPASLQPP